MQEFYQVERGLRDIELALEEPFKLWPLAPYLALFSNAYQFDALQWVKAGHVLNLNGRWYRRAIPVAGARSIFIDIDAMNGVIGPVEAEAAQRVEDGQNIFGGERLFVINVALQIGNHGPIFNDLRPLQWQFPTDAP